MLKYQNKEQAKRFSEGATQMNNDRFLTRVFDTQEKRMLYPQDTFFYLNKEYSYAALNENSIIVYRWADSTDHPDDCKVKFIPFGDRFIPMQCYGLPDKNKKLAYESDIFRGKRGGAYRYGLIERDDDAECLFLSSLERMDEEYNTYNFHDYGIGDLEIIGNRWENPGLLSNE